MVGLGNVTNESKNKQKFYYKSQKIELRYFGKYKLRLEASQGSPRDRK